MVVFCNVYMYSFDYFFFLLIEVFNDDIDE